MECARHVQVTAIFVTLAEVALVTTKAVSWVMVDSTQLAVFAASTVVLRAMELIPMLVLVVCLAHMLSRRLMSHPV